MKKQQSKNIVRYLSDQFIGTFGGFIIGIWASSLVSHFFATRSIKNLWGLTAKKTLVDKQTFTALEWLVSALVGYLVFEIAARFIKNQVIPRISVFRSRFISQMIKSGWYVRLKDLASREDSIVQEMP
jgi:hypothetical protein